jgi:hypothetical protein
MGCTAWPYAVNSTTRPASVSPRATIFTEDSPWEERVAILDEVICCLFLRRYRRNVLVGHFAQDLGDERHLCLSCTAIVRSRKNTQGPQDVNLPACVIVPEAPAAFGPGAHQYFIQRIRLETTLTMQEEQIAEARRGDTQVRVRESVQTIRSPCLG